MVPDPFMLVILVAFGLVAWAVFRLCTERDLAEIDSTEFEETYRDPQDDARGRRF